MSHSPARTVYAQRSMTLTDYLTEHFRNTIVGGSAPRVVRVVAPEVETTGGGKQARQSVHLVRPKGGEPAIVCGFIDIGAGLAQMRSLDALKNIHASRHGSALELDKEDYDEFLKELGARLAEHDIDMKVTDEVTHAKAPPADPQGPARMPAMDAKNLVFLGVGVVVGLLLGALIWSPLSPFR